MVFYSEIEKSFVLTKYFETKSYKKAKSAFSGKFNKSAPNDSYISYLLAKYKNTGSVGNKKRKRKRRVLTEEKLLDIRDDFVKTQIKSLKDRGQRLKIQNLLSEMALKF